MMEHNKSFWIHTFKSHFIFRDLFFIFLFYVVGDTVTTYYGLQLGHQEYNSIMLQLLNLQYGIYYIFVIKLIYIVGLYYVFKYLVNQNCLKTRYYLSNVILGFGVFLTVSNLSVIYTGYNLLQHIGLM